MSDAYVWTVILGLGLFTYLIRFSFLGLAGGSPHPFLARLLRYVPTAVLPALVAPMVAFDRQTGGLSEPSMWGAALVTVLAGALWRNLTATIAVGMASLHLLRLAGL
ncbi:MAG: AzlD domain-containing protein [Rubrimonas sp.]